MKELTRKIVRRLPVTVRYLDKERHVILELHPGPSGGLVFRLEGCSSRFELPITRAFWLALWESEGKAKRRMQPRARTKPLSKRSTLKLQPDRDYKATAEEYAKRYGVTKYVVRQWRKQGKPLDNADAMGDTIAAHNGKRGKE